MDQETEVVTETTKSDNDSTNITDQKPNDEAEDVDVENDHETTTQTNDEQMVDNEKSTEINDDSLKVQKEEADGEEPERPKSTQSCQSVSSTNSIPPLPPLPSSSVPFTPQSRSSVISSLPIDNKFSASFLAKPAGSSPVKQVQKRTLTKSNSDGFFRAGSSAITSDKDSQLIGVSMEHPLGPQCVIRRKIQFDTDDAFIKTFQLYWYVDSLKGCLESPILSSKRVHNSSNPIETPYFVITKNQRRHQAYSCTFCKGKTTFITIVQALRHLKANHRHNVRVLVQDPKGVFTLSTSVTGTHSLHQSVMPTVPVLPWTLPPRAPFVPLTLGPQSFNFSSGLLSVSSVPTSIPSTISPYIPASLRPVQRTTSDIPAEALEDTTRLTSENITYLKNILTQKLSKNVVEVKARGGDEVTVVFSDNKSRVVRLANENTPKSVVSDSNSPIKTSIPVTAGYDVRSAGGLSGATTSYSTSPDRFTAEIPKAKLLRTVSATVNPLYSHIHDNSLRPKRVDNDLTISSVQDYYQAPTKSKYAAKMDYINKKNEIDTAKTHLYKNLSARYNKGNETDDDNSLINGYDTDPEVKHDPSNVDARSIVSTSSCTIDIDSTSVMDQDRQVNGENEEAPSLHGNSVQSEIKSPILKVCDYSTGAITEHATLKLQVEKTKLDSKNLNFSVENGKINMDKKMQNQYYNSFVKVQVLSLSHRCKICSHATATENEMSEHITEHSIKELMNFS